MIHFAGLAAILGGDGFAIVTSSAAKGLLDTHDRLLVAFDGNAVRAIA